MSRKIGRSVLASLAAIYQPPRNLQIDPARDVLRRQRVR
jgi:hypothetical protein